MEEIVISYRLVDSPEDKLEAYRKLFKRLFDPQAAQVALLNLDGVIIETNRAWDEFGRENGIDPSYKCVGANYLQVCEAAAALGAGDPTAYQAYIGLLEVIHTRRPKFTMVYPCHSPSERRWYRMWVEPQLPDVPAIVVAHYLRATKPITDLDTPDYSWDGPNDEVQYQA